MPLPVWEDVGSVMGDATRRFRLQVTGSRSPSGRRIWAGLSQGVALGYHGSALWACWRSKSRQTFSGAMSLGVLGERG